MNTMQQEFDAVVQHLYRQGRPSFEDDHCKYRTEDGLMCAVGCRIPNEMYKPEMDNSISTGLGDLLHMYDFPQEVFTYQEMFIRLQSIHDAWQPWEVVDSYHFSDLVPQLKACAESFGLTYNAPDKSA
jgi:hypothetical protein